MADREVLALCKRAAFPLHPCERGRQQELSEAFGPANPLKALLAPSTLGAAFSGVMKHTFGSYLYCIASRCSLLGWGRGSFWGRRDVVRMQSNKRYCPLRAPAPSSLSSQRVVCPHR